MKLWPFGTELHVLSIVAPDGGGGRSYDKWMWGSGEDSRAKVTQPTLGFKKAPDASERTGQVILTCRQ